MEEEHRQLPSTAGSSVNMEALLTALLETAEIKPFCSCIVAWLTLHQVEAMICIIANPPLLPEPVTSQSDIWAPSQIFGFTLVFRILHIDERKYIMVSKVGREGSGGEKEREKGRCLPPGCQPLWFPPHSQTEKPRGPEAWGGWEGKLAHTRGGSVETPLPRGSVLQVEHEHGGPETSGQPSPCCTPLGTP